jgi:hypothetical protein
MKSSEEEGVDLAHSLLLVPEIEAQSRQDCGQARLNVGD